MSRMLIERQKYPLLGNKRRGEQLVAWSLRQKKGTRWTEDLPFGARISCVADGLSPRVYIHYNHRRFTKFLETLGEIPELLMLSQYGICLRHFRGRTVLQIPGAGKTGATLWDTKRIPFCKQRQDDDVNWLVGMLCFSDEGPVFHDEAESQLQLEEAAAVARLRVPTVPKVQKRKQHIASVLPARRPAVQPQQRLLLDTLLHFILNSNQPAKEKL